MPFPNLFRRPASRRSFTLWLRGATLGGLSAIFLAGGSVEAAGVAVTTDVTGVVVGSTNAGSASQTVPGGGSSGFNAGTNFTLNYNGAVDSILSYAVGEVVYKPLEYAGEITTTLVRVPNPAYTGSSANNNNIVYSRLGASSGTTYDLNAPFIGDEQAVFNANNINTGTDNLFGNTADGNGNNNNVERLDVVFRDGLVATPALAFCVFERGAPTVHDPFGIAAITAVDSAGRPTAYGPLIRFGAGSAYGTYGEPALLPATTNWLVTRNPVANQGALATSPSAVVNNQAIGGVTVAVVGAPANNALGIAEGATIYGYSLFGGDVTGTGGQDLTDPSTFPLTSSGATGAGGIDLIAYTGVLYEAQPVSPVTLSPHFPTDADFLAYLDEHCVTLPDNEVFVAQTRGGNNATNGDYEIGLHVPPDFTGAAPLGGNSQWSWGTNGGANAWVPFTLSRSGTSVTFTMGNYTATYSNADVAELNALGLRVRAATNASTGIRNLTVNGGTLTGGSLNAVNSVVELVVISGLAGDFVLSGEASLNWSAGTIPSGSNLGFQIKGIKGFDACHVSPTPSPTPLPTPTPAPTATPEPTATPTPTPDPVLPPTPTPTPEPTPVLPPPPAPGITLVKTGVLIPGTPATTEPSNVFGLAHEFNALIFDNFRAESGDTDGRLGVAGDLTVIGGYSVGTPVKGHGIPVATNGAIDRLIVGGDFYDGDWGVNGNIVVGGDRHGPTRWLTNGNLLRFVDPITFDAQGNVPADGSGRSFASLRAELLARSAALGTHPDRGVVQKDASLPYRADLVGNDPALNVFNVTAAEWSRSSSSINITAPAGSTVVVNIHGPAVEITNCGLHLEGVSIENVIYNYVDATSLRTTNFAHLGSVLAPRAAAVFVAGSIDGRAVLAGPVQASNGFEFHNFHFTGTAELPVPGIPPSIQYTFTVTNSGALPLENVIVTDPMVTVNGGPILLAPGQTDATTFTATYYPTEDEIDAGELTNTATVTASVTGSGIPVSATSTHVLDFASDDDFDVLAPDEDEDTAPVVTLLAPASPAPTLSVNGRATRAVKAGVRRVTISGTSTGATVVAIRDGDGNFLPSKTRSVVVDPASGAWKLRTGRLDRGRNVIKLEAANADGNTVTLTLTLIKR